MRRSMCIDACAADVPPAPPNPARGHPTRSTRYTQSVNHCPKLRLFARGNVGAAEVGVAIRSQRRGPGDVLIKRSSQNFELPRSRSSAPPPPLSAGRKIQNAKVHFTVPHASASFATFASSPEIGRRVSARARAPPPAEDGERQCNAAPAEPAGRRTRP